MCYWILEVTMCYWILASSKHIGAHNLERNDWIDAHAQNEKTMAKNEPYLPKRSHKIKKDFRSIKGDGDIWMEKTASDVYGNTRTFFECVESGVRKWDEPPTGASRVLYAKDKHKHTWIDEKMPP